MEIRIYITEPTSLGIASIVIATVADMILDGQKAGACRYAGQNVGEWGIKQDEPISTSPTVGPCVEAPGRD